MGCSKLVRNLSEKVAAKFLQLHLATLWEKLRKDDAFSEMFELQASPVECQSLLQ